MAQWVNRLRNKFCKSDAITFAELNFWSPTPNATSSYSRLAGWQAGRQNQGELLKF